MSDDGNTGNITIYNLSQQSIKKHLKENGRVILEAGYEDEPYGMIFDGDLIDYRYYRQDGITNVLETISRDGDLFLNNSYISKSFNSGMQALSLIGSFVGEGDPNMQLGDISPEISNDPLIRGKVLHGQPGDILRNLAKTQDGRFYICDRKICLVKANDPPNGQIYSLTPSSGLISAKQTKEGIEAECLLNPVLNLNKFVHIKSDTLDNEIRSYSKELGQKLPGEGIYKIIKVTHTGETRGTPWYTKIIGIHQPGMKAILDNYIM